MSMNKYRSPLYCETMRALVKSTTVIQVIMKIPILYHKVVEITTMDGHLWYAWHDILKIFQSGDYVKVVGGDFRGRHGLVKNICHEYFINIIEGEGSIGVQNNSSADNFSESVTSPQEIAQQMYMGGIPWQGLHVLVMPATKELRKHGHINTKMGLHISDVHKEKVGTVLDILVNQQTASGLRVCICLEQSVNAVYAYPNIWVDYDEVVEEITGLPLCLYQPLHQSQSAFLPLEAYICAWKEQTNIACGQSLASELQQRLQWTSPPPPRSITPTHEGPSEDVRLGNSWDMKDPEPPTPTRSHWSGHPALAQRELRDLTDVTPLEPTVQDYHRWMVIYGPHIGKYVHGIHYVQGSKPNLWMVQEVALADNVHYSLLGEAFKVPSSDLCQVADSQNTLDINVKWAQSICEELTKVKKRMI
ncbi:hypothetical protein EDD18DRAFT_1102066 [Armillaria luteobubalina]|uniref:KOW domain-containing protein n=1 Tax=Armillaria luteobubalina TaxID=153913 RepID=A0AA39QF29_9AGAR|nr:hypothetical protein EDD18DRAFT_1102066 [Armillaria luteobubalina]